MESDTVNIMLENGIPLSWKVKGRDIHYFNIISKYCPSVGDYLGDIPITRIKQNTIFAIVFKNLIFILVEKNRTSTGKIVFYALPKESVSLSELRMFIKRNRGNIKNMLLDMKDTVLDTNYYFKYVDSSIKSIKTILEHENDLEDN